MPIGAVGSALTQVHSTQTQQVRSHNDIDGDNDGSRAGEVESSEHNTGNAAGNTGRIGSNIDVMA